MSASQIASSSIPAWQPRVSRTVQHRTEVCNSLHNMTDSSYSRDHKNYNLPHEQVEFDRLTSQHRALRTQAGGNYLAQLQQDNVKSILDICCGSGQWVIDMARDFPKAEATGIDLAIPTVRSEDELPNCKFLAGDITQGLPFEDGSFDFVQMRTVPSVPNRGPIMNEITRILRPGGTVQFVEPAETYSTKSTGASTQRIRSPMLEHFDVLLSQLPHLASARADPSGPKTAIKSWSVAPHLVPLITSQEDDQGRSLFHDIQERDFLMPVGVWPTDADQRAIGGVMAEVQMGLIDNFKSSLLKGGVVSDAEYDGLKAKIHEEVYANGSDSFDVVSPFKFVWATKASF